MAVIRSTIVLLVCLIVCGQQVNCSDVDVFEEWGNQFKARFCLTSPVSMYGGWMIKLVLDGQVTNIDTWNAVVKDIVGDGKTIVLGNPAYDQNWLKDEKKCFEFIGYLPEGDNTPGGSAEFVDLPEDEACNREPSNQNLDVVIKNQWNGGFSPKICLDVPSDMDDWTIRITSSVSIAGGLSLYTVRKHWNNDNKTVFVVGPQGWNKKLTGGSKFCFEFMANTAGQYLHPCIDAFFVENNSSKVPIEPTFTTVAATQGSSTTVATVERSTTAATAESTTASVLPETPGMTPENPSSTTSKSGEEETLNDNVLKLFKNQYEGEGTFYGESRSGTCSYTFHGDNVPSDHWSTEIDSLVALNQPQFMKSVTCGLCLKVTGEGEGEGTTPITGTKLVFVKDLCPECHEGDVDIAKSGDGRWKIKIQAVQCPVDNTTIQYAFQGSNQYYVKLQVRNARIPITSLELKKGDDWVTPQHSNDGYWVASGYGEWPEGNIHVKLTAANGEVLNDVIPRIETNQDVIIHGFNRVQVALDPSLPLP